MSHGEGNRGSVPLVQADGAGKGGIISILMDLRDLARGPEGGQFKSGCRPTLPAEGPLSETLRPPLAPRSLNMAAHCC